MPFPDIRFAVKASSSDEISKANDAVSSEPNEISAESRSHDASSSSSSAIVSSSSSKSNVTTPFSPLELFKSRYTDAVQNLEETADFLTSKVKRIFENNFGSSPEEEEEGMKEETKSIPLIPFIIKDSAKPNNDAQLEDSLFRSIHEEARRREEERSRGDRLRAVIKTRPNGNFSPEMQQFRDVLIYTLGAGLFLGYYRGRREARKKFIKLNLATKYTSTSAAKRKLNDFVISAAFRNGMAVGIPLVGFMAVFSGTSTLLSVAENEEKLWHIVAGAAFAGANNRIILGPRAFLVGGLIGGFLGMGFGAIVISMKRASGLATLREKRFHCHIQEVMEDMYEDKRLPAPPRQFELYNDIPE